MRGQAKELDFHVIWTASPNSHEMLLWNSFQRQVNWKNSIVFLEVRAAHQFIIAAGK